MKLKLYILSVFVVLFASCSKEELKEEGGVPIRFSTNLDEETKVSDYFLSGEKLGLFGFNLNPGEVWDNSKTPEFMYNGVLEYSGLSWSTDREYFWSPNPEKRKRFYAYYPYTDGSSENLTLSGQTNAGAPYIDYTITDAKTDFIVCDAREGNCDNPLIDFTARHALAKLTIGFATDIENGRAYARAEKVLGALKSGRFIFDQPSGNGFENATETIDLQLQQPAGGDVFVDSPEAVFVDEYTLYLLPPNNSDGLGGLSKLETVINGKNKEFDLSSVPLTSGKSTNLRVVINQKGIQFSVSIGDWELGGAIDDTID